MYRLRKIVRQQGDASQSAQDISQKLYDIMFADMDLTLREMGVGDLGVAKRIKIKRTGTDIFFIDLQNIFRGNLGQTHQFFKKKPYN